MKKLTLAVSLAALSIGGVAYAHGMMGGGDITRAEAQQKASAMFARMDANGDGLLNDADREARLAKRFDAMDTDKNGAISREEFTAGHDRKGRGAGKPDGMKMGEGHKGGHHGGMGHGMGHGMGGMLKGLADKNNDGAVSAAEFTEAHLAMFDKGDANRDGTLTAAERKAAMEKFHAEMKAAKPAAPAAQ